MLRTVALTTILVAAVVMGCGQESDSAGPNNTEALMNPDSPEMTETAPEQFRVRMETTAGPIVIEVNRAWAPNGADRFYNLVSAGYYDETRFFRVVPNFIVQWGMHGDPAVGQVWQSARIPDDPVVETNAPGTVTFAKTNSPNSRTTQLFINLVDNVNLDNMGSAPFGHVVQGMDVVDKIHTGYGEGQPRGQGPSQARITNEGETYLQQFPELTRIIDMQLM